MMPIIRLSRTVLLLAVALAVVACESFLDVNEDPNSPDHVEMEFTVPGMILNFSHGILGPGEMRYVNLHGPTGWGPEWLQQWSDNRDEHTYAQFQWYEVANSDTNSFWHSLYAEVMNEARNVMEVAEENERWQHHGMAKLLKAWSLSQATDAFGPVPFREALDPMIRSPTYDSQEEIYKGEGGIFELIDEAIAEFQMDDPSPPSSNDLLFQGDMDGWTRLAHSLKARMHMRLAYAPGESPEDRAQAALDALASGIQSPPEAPRISYDGGPGNRQPWYSYENQSEGSGIRTRSSEWYIELLKEHDDPRLPIQANPADWWCPEEWDGEWEDHCEPVDEDDDRYPIYRGNQSGGPAEPDSAISRLGSAFTADSVDHVWFTYEDTRFLEAEANLIIGGPAAADGPYREGIRANMERLGVSSEDIDAYMDDVPPLGDEDNPLEALMMEKFKANFLRDEVWHDWRRTGYPQVPLVEQRVIDGIPQRLRTPATEMERNADQVAETGISTGLDGMLTEVWWASGEPRGF